MKKSLIMTLCLLGATAAHGQHVKIVGIGASTCAHFTEETARQPQAERDYFAWAQGFMSGLLLNAPKGRDESLDLAPEAFPLQRQASFLHAFCTRNPGRHYGDGVIELYLELRRMAGET